MVVVDRTSVIPKYRGLWKSSVRGLGEPTEGFDLRQWVCLG